MPPGKRATIRYAAESRSALLPRRAGPTRSSGRLLSGLLFSGRMLSGRMLSGRMLSGGAMLCAVLALLTGCAAATPLMPVVPAAPCVVVDGPARDRIVLAGSQPAGDTAATLSFHSLQRAHLYDPLVRVDCTGTVTPALAAQWSAEDSVTWRFTIAPDMTFGDGTRATAATVAAALSSVRAPLVASIAAVGSDIVRVTLERPAPVTVFAGPAYHVPGPVTADGTTSGTGPYVRALAAGREIWLARRPDAFAPDTVDVALLAGDPRRALDARVDVLVTSDGAVIEYARVLSDYALIALPWHASYVLAAPARSGTARPDSASLATVADAARPAAVRGAQPPYWWERCLSESATPVPAGAPVTVSSTDVLYAEHDPLARDLAERIVALAWPRESAPAWLRDALPEYAAAPRVRAVPGAALRARSSRPALARVMVTPYDPPGGCVELTRWLDADAAARGLLHVIPLVDVRRYLIHRQGIGRVRVDGRGMIRVGG